MQVVFNLGAFIPLAYILMTNRSADTYANALRILAENLVRTPKTVIVDYELAEIQGFQRVFPKITVSVNCLLFLSFIFRSTDAGFTTLNVFTARFRSLGRKLCTLMGRVTFTKRLNCLWLYHLLAWLMLFDTMI